MKIIKPIVGISKIIDNYDGIVCGFNGVLYNGGAVIDEALHALKKSSGIGKKIAVLSNSPLRVQQIADLISKGDISSLTSFDCIISAGEVLHYRLKNFLKSGILGTKYFNLGGNADQGIFAGLAYQKVLDIANADFLFMGNVKSAGDTIEVYTPFLEYAHGLGLPLICAGNDTAAFDCGEICLGGGAVAEQYAVMGGKIITCGKPQAEVLNYALEDFIPDLKKILFIGDSFATDIKSGDILNTDTVLISKGIHVNFLGEGYIPDIEKARNLAMNFDVYPDYVVSGLRW